MPRTEPAADTLSALAPAAAIRAALSYVEVHRRLSERQAVILCDLLLQVLAALEPAGWPPANGKEAAEFGGRA